MQLTLRYKINAALLITFIVICLVFISTHLVLQNHSNQVISQEIESILKMEVAMEGDALANEIRQGQIQALTLRFDQLLEKGNIFLVSAFDTRGKLVLTRGRAADSPMLSEAEINTLASGVHVRRENWQGIFALVYLDRIELPGEGVGFIRICYSLDHLGRELRGSTLLLTSILCAILVVMLILHNVLMTRTIVKPILSLSDNMKRMRAGKFETQLNRKGRDEIGSLTGAFNNMFRDLSCAYQDLELKKNQLQDTQQYLSNIINSMPSILLGVDDALTVTQWNLQAQQATGLKPGSAVGKPLGEVLPQISSVSEMVHQALHEHAARKMENVQWELGGKAVYVDITVYPLVTGGERGAVIRVDDITDRRQTQEALRESQEKYRLVVEHANDGIIVIQDGRITFANQKTVGLSGCKPEEIISRPFMDFVIEEDKELVLRNYTDRMQGKPVPSSYAFRMRHLSGKTIWINVGVVLITWDNRPATLNFLRDVTDLKKTEEKLMHAQKMEAIGTLAGGIAHDFNNLLQVIQGYAQLLLFDKKDRKSSQRELESIMGAAKKGGELTTQLLTFGRKVEGFPRPVDINVRIEKTKNMLSRTIPKMIDIELRLAEKLPSVYVDPGQIEQVVMNLVLNARDALPERGHILIETDTVNVDENEARVLMVPTPGPYIRMSVSDTGSGIQTEVLDHIFEPFFTTKKLGDGTGLGLAIVYGIVKNHNGSIQCQSIPGEGTTFSVFFPSGSSLETAPRSTPTANTAIKGGTETILLVDDEETLRDIGRKLLEKFGYTVLTAVSAEEALEVYTARGDIDLVILDLVMPGMGGKKGIGALLGIDPDARIVVASGYTFTDAELSKARGVIKKPFVLESMLREVRRALDAPSTSRSIS